MLALFATPVLMIVGIFLALFAGVYQAKLARRLKAYPEDYNRMLVGGKSYLYIESILSQGVPQAIQEQIKMVRYFKGKGYLGKFSEMQRMIYLGALTLHILRWGFSVFCIVVVVCLSGLQH